jgi:ParB family transcriptional regulator, chromosome partitioning protein
MSSKKSALGKGLSALLQNENTDVTSKSDLTGNPTVVGAVATISVDKIEANPFQPRTNFEAEALQELSDSIREQGIIQPVTVRKLGYDKYQLISGERRLKASKMAGLEFIPAYIRIANDQAMLEMALVENIQRENLDAIEIAISYKRLIDECSLTQEQLSDRVSKNRSTVTNYLRLLKLPPEIQIGIRDNKITMGHARALINIDDITTQIALYKEIIDSEHSVRKAEEMARDANSIRKAKGEKQLKMKLSPEINRVQKELSGKFDTKVEIKSNAKGKGKIVIPFNNDDDFNRILEFFDY